MPLVVDIFDKPLLTDLLKSIFFSNFIVQVNLCLKLILTVDIFLVVKRAKKLKKGLSPS